MGSKMDAGLAGGSMRQRRGRWDNNNAIPTAENSEKRGKTMQLSTFSNSPHLLYLKCCEVNRRKSSGATWTGISPSATSHRVN